MKTAIWIIVDSDNRNIVYPAAIAQVKTEIRKYFGSRNCVDDDAANPSVWLTCEVTQDDINALKKIIDVDSIHFVAIIGTEGSNRISGDIIDLREE